MKEVLPSAKATMPADLRRPLLARASKYAHQLQKEEKERKKEQEDTRKAHEEASRQQIDRDKQASAATQAQDNTPPSPAQAAAALK